MSTTNRTLPTTTCMASSSSQSSRTFDQGISSHTDHSLDKTKSHLMRACCSYRCTRRIRSRPNTHQTGSVRRLVLNLPALYTRPHHQRDFEVARKTQQHSVPVSSSVRAKLSDATKKRRGVLRIYQRIPHGDDGENARHEAFVDKYTQTSA